MTFWRELLIDLFGQAGAPAPTPTPTQSPVHQPQENPMSFADDAKAFVTAAENDVEAIVGDVKAAITGAVAKARQEGQVLIDAAKTEGAKVVQTLTDDFNAAKTVYEDTIGKLKAEVAELKAQFAPAPDPAPTAVPVTPSTDPAPQPGANMAGGQ
jgi:hypothetical protein